MQNEPQTASELMMQNQVKACEERGANIILPSDEMRKFLIDAVNQLNYPGSMVEFVAEVKRQLSSAKIGNNQ